MFKKRVILFYFIMIFYSSTSMFVFHENTHIMFTTGQSHHEYFGYSVLLSDDGLLVGAPKGATEQRQNRQRWNSTTGSVYLCPLYNLYETQVTCRQLGSKGTHSSKWYISDNMKSDSWFGASMVTLTNQRLLITAPRAASNLVTMDGSLQGACYHLSPRRTSSLDPFGVKKARPTFMLDGTRPVFGRENSRIYYHPFGEVGFSVTVTKMNTVVLGVPGLLQFTGGIVSYAFDPGLTSTKLSLQPIANPYYTLDLEIDELFGYSVESGIFERNGSVLYIGGAPRSDLGHGKVLVFEPPTAELSPLNIKFKIMGPQVGSYFGASLCCTDINADGLDDLLVGAPTHVKNDGGLPYDQGAVFIYITKQSASGLVLEESGYVSGSGLDGARFGTAIADLGDINSDGFRDIAVGAPWENDGVGAVYIYMGHAKGLRNQNAQRIQPTGAKGFGWSISKGLDVDNNKCNDLAVGAYDSGAAYLYRCIPTIAVRASITVPQFVSLPFDVPTFTAMFCVSAPPMKLWPNAKLNLTGRIEVDPGDDRATLVGDVQHDITITPANEECHERTIYVNKTADLRKPLLLIYELETYELMSDRSIIFSTDATRLSEDSYMKTSKLVQVFRDCGDDLICTPAINMALEALDNPYIPGTEDRFGVKLTVANKAEPAYGAKVNISLPTHPKRIPRDCHEKDLVMTCNLPLSFLRYDSIVWEVEMDYDLNVTECLDVDVKAELTDIYYSNNLPEYVTIAITPETDLIVTGHSIPNTSLIVFRDNLNTSGNISFKHFFKITNLGPSDRVSLPVHILIPEKAQLLDLIEGCQPQDSIYVCEWSIPADTSIPVSISLQMDLSEEGTFFGSKSEFIATSTILLMTNSLKLDSNYTSYQVSTKLILEAASILIWYIVVPCIFLGLLLLSLITLILYKRNFFSRESYNHLKSQENNNQELHDGNQESQLSDVTLPTPSNDDYRKSHVPGQTPSFEMTI